MKMVDKEYALVCDDGIGLRSLSVSALPKRSIGMVIQLGLCGNTRRLACGG